MSTRRACLTSEARPPSSSPFLAAFIGDLTDVAPPATPGIRQYPLAALGIEVVELDTGADVRIDRPSRSSRRRTPSGPLAGLVLALPANPTGNDGA